jgi:hypothetical protein
LCHNGALSGNVSVDLVAVGVVIRQGGVNLKQDAVQEALALWEERERQRTEFLLTLDDTRASLARG